MQQIDIQHLAARFEEIVHLVETTGVAISITREGRPIARLTRFSAPAGKDSTEIASGQPQAVPTSIHRNITPNPRLRVIFAPGYDPAEPLSEEEWPSDCR